MRNKETDVGGLLFGLMVVSSMILAIMKLEWYLNFSWWWVLVPIAVPMIAMIIAVVYVELEMALEAMAKKQVEKEEKLKKQK
jgi:cobalamin synthase